MDRKEKKNTGATSVGGHDVPHDIVESILSRLPLKSLIRFIGVCKRWSATISDPKFAAQRSNSNTSDDFIYKKELGVCVFPRIRLENGEFRELRPVEDPHPVLECWRRVLCGCDGIFLLSRSGTTTDYVLWNPSTRTCREVCFPYPFISKLLDHHSLKFGICYDALLRDYKVVISDEKQYVVYYCSTDSCSELREIITVDRHKVVDVRRVRNFYFLGGIYFKGSIYWVTRSWRLKEEELDSPLYPYKYEILGFDGRDGKLKNSQNLNCVSMYFQAYLTCSREGLYFFPAHCSLSDNLVLMKKVGFDEPWMKIEVKLPFPCRYVVPRNSTQQNKIILEGHTYDNQGYQKKWHLLYEDDDNGTETCVTQIQKSGFNLYRRHLFPIPDNLLLL